MSSRKGLSLGKNVNIYGDIKLYAGSGNPALAQKIADYLGQELGEWSGVHGSKATTRKKYIGKGVHYFPKVGIAEFKLETHSLKVGDKILVTGPTTGVVEAEIKELMVEEVMHQEIKKGVNFTTPIDVKIRNSDKLYVVEDLDESQIGVQR